MESLQSAGEEGASLDRVLQFGSSDGRASGVMGLRVKTGIGGITETVRERVESIQPEATDETSEVRRPAVDIYEEGERVRVVAEMPGVGEEDLDVTVEASGLVLSAETERRRYRRVVSLSGSVAPDNYTLHVENGIVEVVFSRDETDGAEAEN